MGPLLRTAAHMELSWHSTVAIGHRQQSCIDELPKPFVVVVIHFQVLCAGHGAAELVLTLLDIGLALVSASFVLLFFSLEWG